MARHAHRDASVLGKVKGRRWAVPADCDDWGERCIAELIYAVENFAGQLPATVPPPNSYAELAGASTRPRFARVGGGLSSVC